ncbi:hypothetical protein IAQ61_001151 [Plenodomus lingam]|uniref:uncharacterized protein n=1 Tax=Leptosphaeria maculans TaxID=5022 RepID=UPI00332DB432|nr:hypothetical protein IAQ61_001151 [Plenodomus lingam]
MDGALSGAANQAGQRRRRGNAVKNVTEALATKATREAREAGGGGQEERAGDADSRPAAATRLKRRGEAWEKIVCLGCEEEKRRERSESDWTDSSVPVKRQGQAQP